MDELNYENLKSKFLAIKEEYKVYETNDDLVRILASTGTLLLSLANMLISDEYYQDGLLEILFDQVDFFFELVKDKIYYNNLNKN